MVYVHILTTNPELKEYCIPIKKTTRSMTALNLKLPKIVNIESILKTIKEESKTRSLKYIIDHRIIDRLKLHSYSVNKNMPYDMAQLYDGYYFQEPEIYLEFNENSIKRYTDISLILNKEIEEYIDLNDETTLSKLYKYLDNLLPTELYKRREPCSFYIKNYRGDTLKTK